MTSASAKTSIFQAAEAGNFYEVKRLMTTDMIEANLVNDYGYTPLHAACLGVGNGSARLQVIRYLLDEGASVDGAVKYRKTPLMCACAKGDLTIVKVLKKYGADVTQTYQKDGWTPLHTACCYGFLDIVEFLIEEAEAPVNTSDADRLTPLHYAACNGHTQIVGYLLENGAEVNVVQKDGWTALQYASYKGHLSIVKLLIQSEATVNRKDVDENTALYYAEKYGHKHVAAFLRENGAAPVQSSVKKLHDRMQGVAAISVDINDLDDDEGPLRTDIEELNHMLGMGEKEVVEEVEVEVEEVKEEEEVVVDGDGKK